MSLPITNKKMPKNTKLKILCKVDAFSLSKIFPISPIESMAIITVDIILKIPINKPRIKPLYFIELNITFNTQNKDKNRPANNILIVDSFSAIELFSCNDTPIIMDKIGIKKIDAVQKRSAPL